MKRVFLIRHAKSSWSDVHMADHDRPLNTRGKRDAPFMAEILARRYDSLDCLCSSSAKRALTTAKRFAEAYNIPKNKILTKSELYLSGPQTVLSVIRSLDNSLTNVAVFGHNPGWTSIVNSIPKVSIDNVPTTGIAIIECDTQTWSDFDFEESSLAEFLYPKKFR